MKNACYFTLNALFVLKIFRFFRTFWSCRKNGSIRKISLISKSTTSQPGYQRIVMHMLPNISRSRDNRAIKFAQLVEYNMKNIFVEKSYTKSVGETIPRPLSKKSKLSIYLDQQREVINNLFRLYVNSRANKLQTTRGKIKLQTTLFYLT